MEAWPDSSVCRALDIQCQGSRVQIPLGTVFSHLHFSFLSDLVAFTIISDNALFMQHMSSSHISPNCRMWPFRLDLKCAHAKGLVCKCSLDLKCALEVCARILA